MLIESLKLIDFSSMDVDKLLEYRDSEVFDSEWIRAYNEVESMKNADNYTEAEIESNSGIREQVFRMVYDLANDGDLAGCISDDFGLIWDADELGYKDSWMDKLVECYRKRIIPCGRL